MADISRSMYRNSSILSKKLSSSHTFRGKSVYDDVFASSSSSPSSKKLKATFSARMEDYCEIFNCSSSIPFLDLPDVDAVVDIPSSNSDYAAIFGDSLEEAWIESGTTLDEDEDEDTSGLEKNGVPSEDDEMYETVDGKKQFKMSYHQTSIGRRDGISGTTHIAQLHAVSGFTCLIDEVPPLQKTKSIKLEPVSLIGDLSSVTNIQEGLKEEKYHEKVSSDLPKSGFKAGGRSESFSNGVQFNAHKESISKHETYERDHSSSRPDIQKGSMEDKCREQVSSNLSNSGFKEGGRSESFSNGVQFNAHKESISKHETYERDHSSSLPDIQKWSMEDKCREQVSSNLSNSGFKGGRSRSESFSNGMQFNAHKESISEHKTHERDDSSSRPDIQEGSMEDKYLKKFSSNLPNSTSKEFGSAGSFANGMQFNAFSFGSNTHYPAESNSNYGTHEADEFLNAMDDTPTFSDEEVDLNSTAAASATAVRKAIELAQESIRLAKEVMDKHKGMWNSATHSSRSDVKVKELREIKIAGEGKRPKEEKSQRLQEPKKDRIDNFSGINRESARSTTYFPVQGVIMETDGKHSKLEPLLSEYKQAGHRAEDAAQLSSGIVKNETDFKTSLIIEKEDIKKDTTPTDDESDEIWQSAMDTFESSDSDSESLKVDEEDFVPTQFGLNTNAGEQELENSASKIELGEELPDIEGTGKKLEVTEKHFESEEKLNETEKQEECEEDIIDSQEPIEHTNESTTMPWEDYDDKEEVEELQKQLEKGINLEEAHNEDKEKYEVLEDSDNEVHEIKLEGVTVIVEKIHVSRLEEVCGCLEDEKKASHELEVQEASVTVRAEKNEAEDQELEFDDYHNGKGIANRLNEKLEIEGYAIHNEAWKQEESDNTVQEAGWEEERAHEHRHAYLMEEEEADEAEECGLKHRRSYQKQEQESNINTGQESLTHPEKVGEVENLRGAGESYRDENYNANVEAVQNVFTQEEILRMDRDTNPSSEPEESEEVTDADVVEIEPEDKETCAGCVDGDVAGHDDHQIENNGQDVSTSFSTEGEEINKSEEELKTAGLAKEIEQKEMLTTTCSSEDEYEHEVEDIVIELEEEVMRETASFSEEEVLVETASTSEEEQEHNDAKNSLKDEDGAFFIEELVLNLGEASIKSGHEHIIDQNTDEGLACDMGVPVVGPTDKVEESKKKEEAEVPACDQVKELDEIKAANADKDEVNIENKMGADGLNSLLKGKENTTEAAQDTRSDRFTEVLGKLNRAWIAEEKERERERERERVAVERAIHEARERAFTDVRERAEKAAMEKAIEEARQRIKTSVRKTLDKAAEANNSIASNVSSMEAKRKSERAAVERATGEARERALVKAMSEKVAFEAKGHYQGAGPSSSCQYSSNGVSERFDDGAKPESVERNKAKLEKQQRIVERAAKALEEKNKRDLLAQREQAERNRYAEVLDADVKRWLKGKKGNLRALLSTLQYILGPDSGWQPVHLNDIVANSDVKKAYRKATLLVHPDKLQQRGASIQQKYICEKVFDLLKEAWNRFSSEDR